MQLLENRIIDRKYKLKKMLGEGGMGSVWLATHRGTGRPVALKLIIPRFMANEEFLLRFQREARAAGRLRHPNIVDVTDFGFADTDQGRVAYLVMEQLNGAPLSAVLKEEKELPLSWVMDIFEQVCLAVDYAHRHGVIHRDLKPDNIWLTTNDRGGFTIKVLDFGLARLEASDDDDDDDLAAYTGNELATRKGNGVPSYLGNGSVSCVGEGNGSLSAAELRALTEGDLDSMLNSLESNLSVLDLPERMALVELIAANTKVSAPAHGNGRGANAAGPIAETIIGPTVATNGHQPPGLAADLGATVIDGGQVPTVLEGAQDATIVDIPRGEAIAPGLAAAPPAPTNSPALTRVGDIMGTPQYMSPEQCKGEKIGIESDIYSLGVIAYEMMAGQLPFAGTMVEVIKGHIFTEPPQLRNANRRVPRQVAQVVMSALAKSPDERPPNGEAFASMLRAGFEGPMRLLQRAFVTYSEFFPKLLLASVLMGVPAILSEIALFLIDDVLPNSAKAAHLDTTITQVRLVWSVFEFPLSLALMMRLVAQFTLSPLKPLRLPEAFSSVSKRLAPLLLAGFLIGLATLPGLIFLPLASWILIGLTSLTFPAIMVEGIGGWAGLKRGLSLVRRAWAPMLLATALQFGLPFIIEWAFGVEAASVSGAHHWNGRLTRDLDDLVGLGIGILLMPLVATMLSLVYLKARQLGGEPVEDVLAPFEAEENLYSDWQARLHSSLTLNSLINKSGTPSALKSLSQSGVTKGAKTSRYAAPSLRAAPSQTKSKSWLKKNAKSIAGADSS